MREKLRRRLVMLLWTRLVEDVRPSPWLRLEKLGTDYGGWVVPTSLITRDWTCYSGGAGEDISFDLAMIDRFECEMFSFDPTPRSIAFVQSLQTPAKFHFKAVGMWSHDTTMRFYSPRDPLHVSHSILNLQQTDTYFDAPCRSLQSLMDELGHLAVDLLKIDIEGAEHEVLKSMLSAGIRPRVVCTEIDQPVMPLRLWRTSRRLRHSGYTLISVDGWNLTYVRHDQLGKIAT